jgi:hypothetical protein
MLTFVSMGIAAFEENSLALEFPSGALITLDDILSQIDEVKEAPIDSVVTDEFVALETEFSDVPEQKIPPENNNFSQVVQQNIPETVEPNDFTGDYSEPVPVAVEEVEENTNDTMFRPVDDNTANTAISEVEDAVKAGLEFELSLYQVQAQQTTNAQGVIEILGGGGSALGGAKDTPQAQFESEVIDLSGRAGSSFIVADNPDLFGETSTGEIFLSRLIRITPQQPIGFGLIFIRKKIFLSKTVSSQV